MHLPPSLVPIGTGQIVSLRSGSRKEGDQELPSRGGVKGEIEGGKKAGRRSFLRRPVLYCRW
ncbi:MAG: hypothetical protein DSY81_01575 [Bacillota bacterium]|nr:MAG: hypothetical protein DSY92_11595 [Planctomycetota bacterium]RUA11103.1 MAG: hypothetical protein DSY81_01575 [Bacillota bacterium]